jgi:multicomponent Na+:H+ antiporter subunit D
VAIAASVMLVALSLAAMPVVAGAKLLVYKVGNWMPPFGIPMIMDSLSVLMLLISSIVALFVSVYSVGYMKAFTDKWKYYTLLMLLVAGANGVILSGDIFNLYVFLEIASIAVYSLVAFGVEKRSLEASFKYAVMSSVGSVFIYIGIAVLYGYTSTLNMADISRVIATKGPGLVIPFVTTLFIMGFGLKAGLAPFHAWLPDAYSDAPATVPALSSGILIKTLGVYTLARLSYNVFGITKEFSSVLICLGVISMFLGAVMAAGQKTMKRFLGYSSISQIGYIAIALGVGTPMALVGAIFYILNHSLSKTLLFLSAGSMEYSTGTDDLGSIRNARAGSPVAGYAGLLGALSISGIPPLGGFWAKLLIMLACIQAGRPVLAFATILASILTLVYYFKAMTPVIFGKEDDATRPFAKALPWQMNLSLLGLSAIVLILAAALLPNVWGAMIKNAALAVSGGREYALVIFGAITR